MSLNYNNQLLSINNLRLLAGCLGFPRDLVQSTVPNHVISNQSISIKDLCHYSDEGFFTQKLHLTCNTKTGTYNSKVFAKCAQLLSKAVLTIEEIRDIRMIFEAFEEFDQRGMLINQGDKILKTLKIAGWVIAPDKLVKKLRHVKVSYDEKERIQLYEFLDLIPLCEKLPIPLKQVHKHLGDEKTKRSVYKIDALREVLKTEDSRMYGYLNHLYEMQQLPLDYPTFVSDKDYDPKLNLDCFEDQLKKSAESQTLIKKEVQKNDKQLRILRNNTSFGSNTSKFSQNLSEKTFKKVFEKEQRKTKTFNLSTKKNEKNKTHITEKRLGRKSGLPTQNTKNSYKKEKHQSIKKESGSKILDEAKYLSEGRKSLLIKNTATTSQDDNIEAGENNTINSMGTTISEHKVRPHKDFKKKSPFELNAISRRARVLGEYRKDQATQTTENTAFDDYLSQEFSLEDCLHSNEINLSNALNKELCYRKQINRIVKRLWDSKEVSCKKQTNKFIYQKSDMFVANIESLIV